MCMREILLSFERAEELSASWPWFARVASQSNIADDPSRAEFGFLVVTLRTLWLPLGVQKGGEGGGRQTVSPHERKHVLRLRLHIYISMASEYFDS